MSGNGLAEKMIDDTLQLSHTIETGAKADLSPALLIQHNPPAVLFLAVEIYFRGRAASTDHFRCCSLGLAGSTKSQISWFGTLTTPNRELGMSLIADGCCGCSQVRGLHTAA